MLPRNVLSVVVAVALTAATLSAQENTLSLTVLGGAQSPTTDLDRGGSASLESGFTLGAGASLGLHPNVALRADVTWARGDATGPVLGTTEFNRLFYGADVQLRYPFANGLSPFVFAGAGGVRITESDSDADAVNTPAARVGGGLGFTLPGTPFEVFGQATAWHYKFFGWPGLDRYQWDVAYTVGASYRVGSW